MAPEIRFFYAPGACSLAPHILLHEAGLKYEGTSFRIDGSGTDIGPSFKEINPKMRVPTICVDNEIITEVPAVCTAISQLSPEKHLMGKPGIENVRVLEWMNYLSGTLHGGGFGHLFRPGRFTIDESEKAKLGVGNKAKLAVNECFEFVESRLRDGKWAVGEQFTAVDAFLLVFWRWGVAYGFEMQKFPKYRGVIEKMAQKESAREVLALEKIKAML